MALLMTEVFFARISYRVVLVYGWLAASILHAYKEMIIFPGDLLSITIVWQVSLVFGYFVILMKIGRSTILALTLVVLLVLPRGRIGNDGVAEVIGYGSRKVAVMTDVGAMFAAILLHSESAYAVLAPLGLIVALSSTVWHEMND